MSVSNHFIERGEKLLKTQEGIAKFDGKYGVYPIDVVKKLYEDMITLEADIPSIETPSNIQELYTSELKRRMAGEALKLSSMVSSNLISPEMILSVYSIPKEDINSLETFLLKNKTETLDAIERLYKSREVENYEISVSFDVPTIRNAAEVYSAIHIDRYHRTLGKFFQELTTVGHFLRDISAVPTSLERSYYNTLTKQLVIGMPAICRTDQASNLHINERELIRLYGHEGMGHALNQMVTLNSQLPYFLTQQSALVESTKESIAQHFQDVLFEDIKNNPKIQKELGIKHKYKEIYLESKDKELLDNYMTKLMQYSIHSLADKNLGDPESLVIVQKKIDNIERFTLHPRYAHSVWEQYKHSYDREGNLNWNIVSELRYCAQPVRRALEEFKKNGIEYSKKGRSIIDSVLLKGFWTPKGYVDHARLSAEGKI